MTTTTHTNHKAQTYPILVMRCGDLWTEVEDTDLGAADSLGEAKRIVADAGYTVMTCDSDQYEPYGACETNDTVTGSYAHIVTIADKSILDDDGHVHV